MDGAPLLRLSSLPQALKVVHANAVIGWMGQKARLGASQFILRPSPTDKPRHAGGKVYIGPAS